MNYHMSWVKNTHTQTHTERQAVCVLIIFHEKFCCSCVSAGDFAILLHCGMSVRKALLLNVGSAMTSFVGMYISLSVATDLATKQWIAAITAGLFLYVGMVDMVSVYHTIQNCSL